MRVSFASLTRVLLAVVAFLGVSAAAQANEVLYGITFSEQLITIDTGTGAGTLVGNLDSSMAAFGLGTRGNAIYAYDQNAALVRQIDPNTAHTLASYNVGDLGRGEGGVTFRADGIGFANNASGGSGTLFNFDITGPSSNVVGGITPSMDGLDFNKAGVLYGLSQGLTDSNGEALYTVDQNTAATTLVGALGTHFPGILGGLAFSSNGTLYAEVSDDGTTSELYRVDPNTGVGTFVGNIGFGDVSGLTFLGNATVIPEPASATLLAVGFAGLLGIRRMRKKA